MQAMDRMKRIRIFDLHPGINPGEGQLLSIVASQEQGISVSALARQLEMPMPAVSRMMRHMEDRGLIDRRILPQDRRSILVTVTPEGKATAEDFLDRMHMFFQELLSGIEPEEFDIMMATWNRMMDRMENTLKNQLAMQQQKFKEVEKEKETREDTI